MTWERGEDKMTGRKRVGGGDRQQDRGTGQAGRDQQGSKAQRGHPASWQRLPVTSWQGRGDGRQGERDMQDTGVFVYLIRGGKKGSLRTRLPGSCDLPSQPAASPRMGNTQGDRKRRVRGRGGHGALGGALSDFWRALLSVVPQVVRARGVEPDVCPPTILQPPLLAP